ncbi:Twinfilin-2 [Nymphon striatum]|nr:Twinfilin-2 [Nymphon striatum]
MNKKILKSFLKFVKVFIYSNPGYSCSIKERMLYSSCKSPVVQAIEQQIGIPLAKKIEIDDSDDLTEKFLFDEIHPKENIYKQKFSKPKGPPNRGAKRITKPNQDGSS